MELSDTVRASILNAIDDDIGTAGEVRFFTAAAATEVAAINLNNPAFLAAGAGTATSGQMDLNTTPALEDTSPAAAGTVDLLRFYASTAATNGAYLLNLGVAATGSPDITMSNTTVATTDTVQLTSLRISCPAGAAT